MYEYDELGIYRGRDIQITNTIKITQPTLGQIEEFGEQKYFSAIHTLTSVGADLKWQLWDLGIDYTKIEDFDLFIKLTSQLLCSRKNNITSSTTDEEKKEMIINPLQLVLNIDLADYTPCKDNRNNEIILYNRENDSTIDKFVYIKIVDVIRKMHNLKRNNEIPGNETTKMILIEDARDEYNIAKNKPYKSLLMPLISALTNCAGFKYGINEIWDMKINAFFDSINRINRIQESNYLLQGAYSGFSSLKGVDKSRLNWTSSLDD